MKRGIILKSERPKFILRHFKMSDLKDYFELQKDKAVQRGFMASAKTLAEARKKLKQKISNYRKKKPKSENFVIEIDGKFVGFVSLHDLNEKYFEHKGVVGYSIHPKFRKKGITTKALKLVTDHAFKKYKLKRIEGWCRTFNKASARVLEKAGYKLEGVLRKNKCKNGKYLDDMIWAKVK